MTDEKSVENKLPEIGEWFELVTIYLARMRTS